MKDIYDLIRTEERVLELVDSAKGINALLRDYLRPDRGYQTARYVVSELQHYVENLYEGLQRIEKIPSFKKIKELFEEDVFPILRKMKNLLRKVEVSYEKGERGKEVLLAGEFEELLIDAYGIHIAISFYKGQLTLVASALRGELFSALKEGLRYASIFVRKKKNDQTYYMNGSEPFIAWSIGTSYENEGRMLRELVEKIKRKRFKEAKKSLLQHAPIEGVKKMIEKLRGMRKLFHQMVRERTLWEKGCRASVLFSLVPPYYESLINELYVEFYSNPSTYIV